jgi:hypothetical protein
MHCIVDLGSTPDKSLSLPTASALGPFFAQPVKRDSNFGRSDLSWHHACDTVRALHPDPRNQGSCRSQLDPGNQATMAIALSCSARASAFGCSRAKAEQY